MSEENKDTGENIYVVDAAPSVSMGNLMLSSSHSLCRLFESVVTHQVHETQTSLATTSKCVTAILTTGDLDKESVFKMMSNNN